MNKMTNETIHSLFLKTAEKCRDNIAFNYFDQTWKEVSYAKFSSDSKAIASYLIKTGTGKGDRIAIISENRPEWCISYMGIMLSGAVAVPIDSQLYPDSIRNFLADSDTKIIFCSSKTEENIEEALKSKSPHPPFTKGGQGGIMQISFDSPEFKEILNFKQTEKFPDTYAEDIASIIYTSGTTGVSKGVMLTHRNFLSDAEAVIKADVISVSDSCFPYSRCTTRIRSCAHFLCL
ncbi:MAG: hypothetical protein EPN94_10225 [Nitrospirae bacterium]|nr:MAG: hypothetical protein EPN94_10225 [Nitrospirota bacterium]